RIWKVGLGRREREVFIVCENWIWVRFDEINFVLMRQSQIETRVTVNCQQSVNVFTGFLDVGDKRWIEVFGELILQTPAFAIFLVPFRVVRGNLRLVRRHCTKDQLADWKNTQPHIAHQTYIKLAPLDVFLGDGVAIILLVNKSHPFSKLFLTLDE